MKLFNLSSAQLKQNWKLLGFLAKNFLNVKENLIWFFCSSRFCLLVHSKAVFWFGRARMFFENWFLFVHILPSVFGYWFWVSESYVLFKSFLSAKIESSLARICLKFLGIPISPLVFWDDIESSQRDKSFSSWGFSFGFTLHLLSKSFDHF